MEKEKKKTVRTYILAEFKQIKFVYQHYTLANFSFSKHTRNPIVTSMGLQKLKPKKRCYLMRKSTAPGKKKNLTSSGMVLALNVLWWLHITWIDWYWLIKKKRAKRETEKSIPHLISELKKKNSHFKWWWYLN